MKQLKIGQSVVLMDSNLRGKIVAIGRRVSIELEDGMVLEAAYGEFTVTDTEEINALLNTAIATKGSTMHQRGPTTGIHTNIPKAITIDLHIEKLPGGRNIPQNKRLPFQLEVFRRVLRENLPHRGRQICFVHGHGDGILKAAIRKELDEVYAQRCTYSVGDPAVTVVRIR